MITHLEECEVKWALGSITTNKASGGDGIPVHLFQILKDAAVKVLHSICQQIWKTQQWLQDWKRIGFRSNPKERQCQRMLKLLHTYIDFTKIMLKILQARLQQYVNQELPDVQAEEPEIKLPTSTGSEKKQECSRKTATSALLTKPDLDYVDNNKL